MAAAGGKQARAGATPPPRRGARPAPTSPGSAAASGPEFRSAERAAVRAPRGTVSASGGAARKAAAQAGRWGCRGRPRRTWARFPPLPGSDAGALEPPRGDDSLGL